MLGASGAGKSTLLHLLAGVMQPSAGRVLSCAPRPALVLQHPERQLFCATVFDEVAFGLRHRPPTRTPAGGVGQHGEAQACAGGEQRYNREAAPDAPPRRGARPSAASREALEPWVHTVLAQVGLEPARFAHRHPLRLSGGEQRRLAIACALVLRPRFLLLDEPLAGLDTPGRRAVLDLLARARSAGQGVVVASHAIEPFVDIIDRVLVLRLGCLAADGPPETVLAEPSVLREAGLQPHPLAEAARLLRSRGRPAPNWRTPEAFADGLLKGGVFVSAGRSAQPRPPPSPFSLGEGHSSFPLPLGEGQGEGVSGQQTPLPPPATRPLHALDPRAKLLAAVLLMLPLLAAPTLRNVSLSAVALLLAAGSSGHVRTLARGLMPIAWLSAGLVMFTTLAEPRERVWLLGLLPFSPVGAAQGGLMGARMLELVAVGMLLSASTPPSRLAAAVAWLLQPLRAVRLDPESFSLALMLALHFVPLFQRELATTERAMLLRGASFGNGPVQQVRRLAYLAVPSIGRLLVASEDLAAALVSRGYGLAPLAAGADLRIGRGDVLLLAAAFAVATFGLLLP